MPKNKTVTLSDSCGRTLTVDFFADGVLSVMDGHRLVLEMQQDAVDVLRNLISHPGEGNRVPPPVEGPAHAGPLLGGSNIRKLPGGMWSADVRVDGAVKTLQLASRSAARAGNDALT